MKNSMSVIKIILFTIFVNCSAAYSYSKVRFEHLTIKQGLSINWIYSICQDREGFIWFGTWYGLNKYDGYTFTSYIHDPDYKKTGLLDNNINTIHEDKYGRLWVGTYNGLHLVDKITGQITPFLNQDGNPTTNVITTITEDKKDNLWLGSFVYLQQFNYNTKHYKLYELPNGWVNSILSDSSGKLWIGSTVGLYRFDPVQNRYTLVRIKNSPDGQPGVTTTYLDQEGVLWVGTNGEGLFKINTKNKSLKADSFNPGNLLNQNITVNGIIEDNKGLLWVGSSDNGLQSINKRTNSVVSYKFDPSDPGSLNSNTIQSIYMDKTGNIWVGTTNGINKIPSQIKPFFTYQFKRSSFTRTDDNRVESVLQDKTGLIWLAMPAGLVKLDSTLNRIAYFPFNPFDLQKQTGQWVQAVYEDRKGQVWIGTDHGLQLFSKSSGKFIRYPFTPPIPFPLKYYSITEDTEGKLWIGGEGGLVAFDPVKNQYTYYHNDPEDSTSLQTNFLRGAMASSTGDIWVYSVAGVSRLNQETGKFKHYTPGDSTSTKTTNEADILDMYEDTQGIIWIATSQGGLNRFDPETNLFSYFTTKDGLSSNNIESIIGDDKGNLWLGTNRGITRFNPKTKLTTIFDENDGLPDNEFIRQSKYKRNGELLFGNLNGLVVFNPDSIRENEEIPIIHITDLKVLGKSVPIIQKEIELSYNKNYLSFDFVALSYNAPEKNQYAYKLEGLDKDWIYVGTRRYASYTNLNPGKYIFHVKGSNSDGVWNEEGKKISIVINPAPWATWWAYTFYVLFAGLLLFSIRRFELNRQRKNSEIKESKLRAEAAELQAKAAEAQAKVIQAENDRKTKELEEARNLQLSMLPKEIPQLPNLNIAVYMQTATEVGGDYYDFSTKEDGSLNICLGDATGHGMKAGTLVSMMKSLFTAESVKLEIGDFFISANTALKKMSLDKMMMAFSMLNIDRTNKIQIANAGIPPIYIHRKNTNDIEEINLKGLPLGAMKYAKYEIYETELNSGDTILMLSDGMPELRNKNDEMFGYKRMKNIFDETANNNPEEIINSLNDAGSNWTNNKVPDDDVTFVVIKVK